MTRVCLLQKQLVRTRATKKLLFYMVATHVDMDGFRIYNEMYGDLE